MRPINIPILFYIVAIESESYNYNAQNCAPVHSLFFVYHGTLRQFVERDVNERCKREG